MLRRDFNGANLSDSDLTGVNLSSIDPTKSDAIASDTLEVKAGEKHS
ncbi:pentapeptide repeat-containing protein [Nostoc sp. XA010]|nr:pentapeptide repeat-containing protein [Nostoc sp. XA010]